MKKVVEIVNLLKKTPSTNDKIALLKANKNNEMLQKIMKYTYNDNKYGITKEIITPYVAEFATYEKDIFELLDRLASSNINDDLRTEVGIMLGSLPQEEGELILSVLTKDLRCGISTKTVQKIWKDLIPTFAVMLAKSYRDFAHKIIGEFIITTKLDGSRVICWREGDSTKIYSRQGKEFVGLVELESDLKLLPSGIVFDGELIAKNPNKLVSKDLFQLTRKLSSKNGDKTGLEFHVFDMLPLGEFRKGISSKGCYDRKIELEKLLSSTKGLNVTNSVPILYHGVDTSKIMEFHTKAKSDDLEGIMINLAEAPYVCKRTDTLLKVKEFYTLDLKIVGVQEGTGKYKEKLGALLVEYKSGTVSVGSGFTDLERKYLWDNKDMYLGRIVEVQYFEQTKNENGEESLRFPTYKRIRELDKEVSYY